MYLTEDEAKQKWCPHARAPGRLTWRRSGEDAEREGVTTQNRGYQMGGSLQNCQCIASRCMAWRTADIREMKKVRRGKTGFAENYSRFGKHDCAELDGELYQYEYSSIDVDGHFDLISRIIGRGGYCGAFGKPDYD